MANIINKYVKKYTDKVVSKVDKLVDSFDVTNEKQAAFSITNDKGVSSINAFRNKLEAKNGLARNNQFMVSFELPSWMNDSKWLSYLGVTQFNEELGILCNKFTPPTKNLQSTSVIYSNNIERKIPLGYKWEEVTFSFIERNDYFIYNTFNEWIDGINNPITNTGRFYNDITADVKINFLDKHDNILAYYVLLEAYPTSITISEYNWETLNQFVNIDVSFNYIYGVHRDYDLSTLVKSVQEFGSSDVVSTIADITSMNWKEVGKNLWNKIF